MAEPVHIISLGAGVQSSTMALMAAHGEITPMPKCAIFADTQEEPDRVYEWLDWLEKRLPFPVHRVTKKKLGDVCLELRTAKDGSTWAKSAIPFYTLGPDGSHGHIGHRTCTYDYKLLPLLKKAKHEGDVKRGQKEVGVIQWIGISLDEWERMKESFEPWAKCRWPLIEMRITRQKCIEWMKSHGYPEPPRSACYFCPFHSRAEWRRMQLEDPDSFAKAAQFERDLQAVKAKTDNIDGIPFLTPHRKPLETIDFRSDEERGQKTIPFPDEEDWKTECIGLCGN